MTISSLQKPAFSLLVVGLSLFSAQSVLAANAVKSAELAAVQARGVTDIAARTTSLTNLVAKVTAASRLTTAQKTALTSEMQAEITGLNTLKTTLSAQTDVTMARTDFQNIFQEHYIYAFYVPRVERIVAADGESDASTTLTAVVTKLQGYLTQLQDQGKDITALQDSLNDMQAKIGSAQVQSGSVLTSLVPLKAAGYPGNKATIEASAATLKTARASLKVARADAATIIAGIKALAK